MPLQGDSGFDSVPGALFLRDIRHHDDHCLALDEAQNLTPIESMVLVELAASRRRATVLIAGDEAQTVRPTDFDWGWFQDLLHARLASPHEFHLPVNLRSSRPIARLVNSVWELYSTIGKQDRPGGAREADIEEETGDQVVLCAATPAPGLEALLRAFAAREGLALVTLDDAPPRYVPEDVRRSVMTVPEVKGLDFRSVCLLDPSRHLQAILSRPSFLDGRGADPLATRLALDSLRVAVSRPSERIYLLDVDPPTAGATAGRVTSITASNSSPDWFLLSTFWRLSSRLNSEKGSCFQRTCKRARDTPNTFGMRFWLRTSKSLSTK